MFSRKREHFFSYIVSSMNTALSVNGRGNDTKGHPQSEIRGATSSSELLKTPERFAAQQQLSGAEALKAGME